MQLKKIELSQLCSLSTGSNRKLSCFEFVAFTSPTISVIFISATGKGSYLQQHHQLGATAKNKTYFFYNVASDTAKGIERKYFFFD